MRHRLWPAVNRAALPHTPSPVVTVQSQAMLSGWLCLFARGVPANPTINAFSGHGDSMELRFGEGDGLIVNVSRRRPATSKTAALSVRPEPVIKSEEAVPAGGSSAEFCPMFANPVHAPNAGSHMVGNVVLVLRKARGGATGMRNF